MITDPQGNKTGVDAATDQQHEETTGVESYRDFENSHIIFNNPVDGDYHVKLSGTFPDRLVVDTSFVGTGEGSEIEVPVFFDGTEASFTLRLDQDGMPQLTVVKPQSPPENLVSANDAGNTGLEWQHPATGAPAQYKLYARRYDEPFFSLLATVPGTQTSYAAAQPWDTPKYFYTMSAVNAQGSESLLTETVKNQDLPLLYVDSDFDGIADHVENASCTNPMDADTDDDGIKDGDEDKNHNGIVDAGETNPCNADTDGDGIQDGTELGVTQPVPDPDGAAGPLLGTDTAKFQPDLDPATKTDPLNADTDGDGLKDGEEDKNHNGRVDAGETDPTEKTAKDAAPVFFPIQDKNGGTTIIYIE